MINHEVVDFGSFSDLDALDWKGAALRPTGDVFSAVNQVASGSQRKRRACPVISDS
jgi:hypothetical protein